MLELVVLLSIAVDSSTVQVIRLNGAPLEGAFVYYWTPGSDGDLVEHFEETDANGQATIPLTGRVRIVVEKYGYRRFDDIVDLNAETPIPLRRNGEVQIQCVVDCCSSPCYCWDPCGTCWMDYGCWDACCSSCWVYPISESEFERPRVAVERITIPTVLPARHRTSVESEWRTPRVVRTIPAEQSFDTIPSELALGN